MIVKSSVVLLILVLAALVAYGLIAPGLAQNKAQAGADDGTPVQLSTAADKDVGPVSLYTPNITETLVPPEQQTADAFDINRKFDPLNVTTSGLLAGLREGLPVWCSPYGTADQWSNPVSPFMGSRFPSLTNVYDAAASGQAGSGNTAGSAGDRIAGETDAPDSSRYIVVFKDSTPSELQMAKEQVKGFAESQDGKVVHDYSIIAGLTVSIPDDKAAALSSLGTVKYVEKDQLVHADLDRAVPQIGADLVQDLGYDGSGVSVCVIDTGIDASHPDMNDGKVIKWVDYVQHRTTPYDDNGHGTHVSSTIAGTGSASGGLYQGVAPGASLMGAKVLDSSGSGSYSDVLAGINWAVTNNARVISMSLGGGHSQAMDDAVTNSVNHGVVVVVSAGNSGPSSGTIGCPGDSPAAITVGAVDRDDVIAYFSSRGPTAAGTLSRT